MTGSSRIPGMPGCGCGGTCGCGPSGGGSGYTAAGSGIPGYSGAGGSGGFGGGGSSCGTLMIPGTRVRSGGCGSGSGVRSSAIVLANASPNLSDSSDPATHFIPIPRIGPDLSPLPAGAPQGRGGGGGDDGD